ncbi:nicotinamide riboside transporter PnuC [Flavobacterium turcicum]|uniref:Nicotinamide riboside transporter PnuC n=1 Tax=Flavobacterium turcicum TaxID=2764718 RepID=A0ABR7JCR8_9FLAO|nr:nicotinamide riboside transporter PnuC [Flavobacterium turcicum]MBC5862296.1 nicotinamide mononucleotide transporter [Flavobacterium turcicum]NHL01027.1 nicotinamide mononucleotide transporter [Flavobacterium turcicum]
MFDYFFAQYSTYPRLDVYLEIIAVIFGLLSVWCAKKDNIWVFPTGLVSTLIFVYLLWKWVLWGDMMINGYYFIMSIYGWYHWTRKKGDEVAFPIATISSAEKRIAIFLFIFTVAFVVAVYHLFDKFTTWYAYVDTFITGIFFVGMWLMAKRKVENWIFWIIGDVISIPLYFFKGYTFTSFQYVVFTIVAIFGYLEWKKISNSALVAKTE